jgi:hypothetical protein
MAAIVALFSGNDIAYLLIGGNWNSWYAPYGLASLSALLAIALFGFWRSLGGRQLLGTPP